MVSGLTPRARAFLDTWGRRSPRIAPVVASGSPEWARQVVLAHEEEFGGLLFPVLGGELSGWIRLGTRTSRIRTSSAGELIFNFAEPQFVQCGLVCRVDGYFGVSWSEEFLPWHADARRLIESSAMWAGLVGWRTSALCDGKPDDALAVLRGLHPEECGSSRETAWWRGDDIAVHVEPHLTYLPEGSSRVHVLTSGSEADRRVKRALEEAAKAGADLLVRPQNGSVAAPEESPFH